MDNRAFFWDIKLFPTLKGIKMASSNVPNSKNPVCDRTIATVDDCKYMKTVLEFSKFSKWTTECIPISMIYSYSQIKWHPYLISTIEIRVLWMEIKCLKCATRLLNRICVNKGELGLFNEVLWVSVGQRAAELPAIKVGGLKKDSADRAGAGTAGSNRAVRQNFFLTSNFDSP